MQRDFVVARTRDIVKRQFFTSENFFHGKGSKTSAKADSRSKTANQCKVIRVREDVATPGNCLVLVSAHARAMDRTIEWSSEGRAQNPSAETSHRVTNAAMRAITSGSTSRGA